MFRAFVWTWLGKSWAKSKSRQNHPFFNFSLNENTSLGVAENISPSLECDSASTRIRKRHRSNKQITRNIQTKHCSSRKQRNPPKHHHKGKKDEAVSSNNLTTVTIHHEDSSSPLILDTYPSHSSSAGSSFDENLNLSLSESIPLYNMYDCDMPTTCDGMSDMSGIRRRASASSSDDFTEDYHCV